MTPAPGPAPGSSPGSPGSSGSPGPGEAAPGGAPGSPGGPDRDTEWPAGSDPHGVTAADPPAAAEVRIEKLNLRAGARSLLEDADARFEPGRISLIVGASGAGKSLLLRVLARLLGPGDDQVHVDGRIRIQTARPHDGRTPLAAVGRGRPGVGVVFQHFALFDEFSPTENVRFALAHRRTSRASDPLLADPTALLEELKVPTNVRTTALSGGQQQRLAIARTLAHDPDVVLYDEPTSGLDTATAMRVADLIRQTHAHHPRTVIIVTHDYASLLPIADACYLLDTRSRGLECIERDRWADLPGMIHPPPAEAAAPPPPPRPATTPLPLRAGRAAAGAATALMERTGRVAEAAIELPWRLLPAWPSPRWGLRYALHYLRLVAGPSAWVYLAIIGAIIGFVATDFTFRFMPYSEYTEPLLTETLLEAIGFALYRVLVPLLATVLIAARCGAAVASDVGGRTFNRQVDAMRSLGAPPRRYLLTGILYAFLLGTPLLVALSFFTARLTSLAVFTATHPHYGPWIWRQHFHGALWLPDHLFYEGTGWLLAKVLCCAAGTALIAYHRGAAPKPSGRDVSRGITSTILWATIFVLLVHFTFAFFEY